MQVENLDYTLVEKIENVFKTLYENKNIFPKEFIMNLQYVIDMLVNNQSNTKEMTATRIVVERNTYEMQKLNEERYERQLETYKKIAENLANKLEDLILACYRGDNITVEKEIIEEYIEKRMSIKEELINEARKEVEND